MLTTIIVSLFFVMLLAPCLFAILGAKEPEAQEHEASVLPAAAETASAPAPALAAAVSLNTSSVEAEASPVQPASAEAGPGLGVDPLAAQITQTEVAAAEIARVQALRALLEAGEAAKAKADAARMEALVRSLDLDDLRRMIAIAEREAVAAQVAAAETQLRNAKVAAAQARAAELAEASRLASERAALAAQAAEITRKAAEEATRVAQAAREAQLKRQAESGEMDGATDPPGTRPEDPSMHYPRARVIRNAA